MFGVPGLSASRLAAFLPGVWNDLLFIQRGFGCGESRVGAVPVQKSGKSGNFVRQCFNLGVGFLFRSPGFYARIFFCAFDLPFERSDFCFKVDVLVIEFVDQELFFLIQFPVALYDLIFFLNFPGQCGNLLNVVDFIGVGVSTFAKLLNGLQQLAVLTLQSLTFLLAHDICFFQPHCMYPPENEVRPAPLPAVLSGSGFLPGAAESQLCIP